MRDTDKTKEQLIDELAKIRQQVSQLEVSLAEHESIREVLKILEHMVSITDDRIALIDRNYIYKMANYAYLRAQNKTRDEIIGHSAEEVLGSEAFAEFFKGYIDQCLAGEQVHYRSWLDFPGLGRRYLDVFYTPFIETDGTASGVFVSSRDITDLKRAEKVLMEQSVAQTREEELKRSRKRIVTVQESLRKEIAQQLHGTVQNRLIVILHRLAQLEQLATEEKLAMELRDLNIKLKDLIEKDVRSISHRLYPSILRQGLIPALQSLGDQVEATLNLEMELDESLVQREVANRKLISDSLKLAVYRIVEEALVNVVKHASASKVSVQLKQPHGGRLKLTVRDNGEGFDKANSIIGVGIAIMQDYAEMMDGRCTIQSTPGKGTKVTAIFPFAKPHTKRPERDLLLE